MVGSTASSSTATSRSMSEELDSHLVRVTRLRDLFQEQGRARGIRGFLEREFLSQGAGGGHDGDNTTGTGGDAPFAFTDTMPEYLVSLGLTWRKLNEYLGQGQGKAVIWMGEDTYIQQWRPGRISPRGFRRLLTLSVGRTTSTFAIIISGTSIYSESYSRMMNLLAQIIAFDDTCAWVCFNSLYGDQITDETVFPFPVTALDRLVSQAKSVRFLSFSNFHLSHAQSRVLFNRCHDNISLRVNFERLDDGGAALIEALILNQSPAKISLSGMAAMTEASFREFIDALKINVSLKDLSFNEHVASACLAQRMGVLLQSLVEIRGLGTLSVKSFVLSTELWQDLWVALTNHSSIKRVNVQYTTGMAYRGFSNELKVHRDNCIVEALQKNAILTDLEYTASEHDLQVMRQSIFPKLDLNRFRPRIQALRKVPNLAVRQFLVGKALLNCRVQDNPSIRYLLLSVNSDLVSSLLMGGKNGNTNNNIIEIKLLHLLPQQQTRRRARTQSRGRSQKPKKAKETHHVDDDGADAATDGSIARRVKHRRMSATK